MNFQILGFSPLSLAILADMIADNYKSSSVDVFMNKDFNIKPRFPNSIPDLTFRSLGELPSKMNSSVFGVSGPRAKSIIFRDFKSLADISKSDYVTIIDSSAYVAPSSILGTGSVIEPNVIISSQSRLGFGIFVKRGSSIGHHNELGDFVDIHPGVTVCGNVRIGKGSVIGAGSVIRDEVSIGCNSFIGMGSIVTKDVPSGVIAYGSPCKVIKDNKGWELK